MPFEEIKSAGFNLIILDKDNTITSHKIDQMDDSCAAVLSKIQGIFGYDSVFLFSNDLLFYKLYVNDYSKLTEAFGEKYVGSSDGSQMIPERKQFDIHVISNTNTQKKPFCENDISDYISSLDFKKKEEIEKRSPESNPKLSGALSTRKDIMNPFDHRRTVVVGDRIATDVILGNSISALSILVLPLDPPSDTRTIRYMRCIEKMAWRVLFRNKLKPHENPQIQSLASKININDIL